MSDKLNEQQRKFVDALMGEAKGCYRKAMRAAGYSENYTMTSLLESKALCDAIQEAAQRTLTMNAPKAALGMVGILDDPTALGAKNMVTAAKEVLDRVGIVKQDKLEVSGPTGTMFILPPKDE